MFSKGSRYEQAVPFAAAEDGTVFQGVRPRAIGKATGMVEHVVQAGDRMDTLARNYYNNARLWWRILDANPDVTFGGDFEIKSMEGEVILIPKAKE